MTKVNLHFEDIQEFPLVQQGIETWIENVLDEENKELKELNYVFCSDNYLLEINQKYLNHDYFTDVITFDNSNEKAEIEGDIFISWDRIQENAKTFEIDTFDELNRVMIHGVLHLCGYMDKTDHDQQIMKQKEDSCLSLRENSDVPRGTNF